MKRLVISSLLTFTLGVAGGAVGSKLFPGNEPGPLAARPAIAAEVHIAGPANDGVADLVDRVKYAVVNIDTVSHRTVSAMPGDPFQFFFNGQGGMPMPRQQEEEKGIGSGFIIRDDGLIVTNNHVIRGAEKLTVTLADGKKYTGRVMGADPGTDLALVKIDAHNLTTLKLASPSSLRVGEYVVAMGSPLGLSQTVTSGILSAMNRDITQLNARVGFLQTDAAINPGNSGGPLLNLRGEVIGVNTAIAARGQGIGFAVPVDTLQAIIPQLESKGRVERAWLGVGVTSLPEDRSSMFYPADHGVLVGRVEPNSPADHAGLKGGDVIVSLNGQSLDSPSQLIREVGKLSVGNNVSLVVNRQGQQKTISLTLAKLPEKLADAANQPQQEPQDEGDGN